MSTDQTDWCTIKFFSIFRLTLFTLIAVAPASPHSVLAKYTLQSFALNSVSLAYDTVGADSLVPFFPSILQENVA